MVQALYCINLVSSRAFFKHALAKGEFVIMKKKLLILLFMGLMLTGCADKENSRNEGEPEVISLDLNEDGQDSGRKDVQENGIDSSSGGEMIPSGAGQESQEQTQTQELSVGFIKFWYEIYLRGK